MKINCDSCGAKYTIADEKVRGRTVKIRCKKCSAAIVVKGTDSKTERQASSSSSAKAKPAPARPSGDGPKTEWTVVLDDDSQRSGTPTDIADLYRGGLVHANCYVWRDGMGDWQTLGETPELFDKLTEQLGTENHHDNQLPSPKDLDPPPHASAPDAGMRGDFFGAGNQAQPARVDKRDHDQDIFGASDTERDEDDVSTSAPSRIPHKPIAQRFTAERSENSVLFTIDAIMGAANKSGKKPPSPIEPADKIDFGAIATSLPPPPDDGGGFDSSIDAGQSFGAPAYASLSAPMLPTSIEPPPPERESSVGAQTKPNKGLVIGLVAAVAALTIVGGALAYMMMSKDTANTVAAVTAEPTQPAVVEKPVDKIEDKPAVEPATEPTVDVKAEDDKDKVAANADDKAKENSDGEPPDPDGRDNSPEARAAWAKYQKSQGSDKGDPGSKTDGKTEPKPDTAGDAKKPPPSDEPKATAPVAPPPKTDDAPPPPKPAAASGPGPFDRPAAIAALNAAAGQAAGCKKPGGPVGQGRVSVTFATSGNVANVALAGELAGTSADSCIKSRFRAAKVPPFTGSPVTLPKTISIN